MGFPEGLDDAVLRWFQARHTPWLDPVMASLTDLGHRYVIAAVVLVAVAVFLVRRQFRAALLLVVAGLVSWGLIVGIKDTVQRPRPPRDEVRQVGPSPLSRALGQPSRADVSYSFPSGHALSSAANYLTLALLAARRLRRRAPRIAVLVSTAVLVFVIGVTRLYLGRHYLTDVLAGWALGVGVALVCGWVDRRWAARAGSPFSSI